jgi:hypothetical protein
VGIGVYFSAMEVMGFSRFNGTEVDGTGNDKSNSNRRSRFPKGMTNKKCNSKSKGLSRSLHCGGKCAAFGRDDKDVGSMSRKSIWAAKGRGSS